MRTIRTNLPPHHSTLPPPLLLLSPIRIIWPLLSCVSSSDRYVGVRCVNQTIVPVLFQPCVAQWKPPHSTRMPMEFSHVGWRCLNGLRMQEWILRPESHWRKRKMKRIEWRMIKRPQRQREEAKRILPLVLTRSILIGSFSPPTFIGVAESTRRWIVLRDFFNDSLRLRTRTTMEETIRASQWKNATLNCASFRSGAASRPRTHLLLPLLLLHPLHHPHPHHHLRQP